MVFAVSAYDGTWPNIPTKLDMCLVISFCFQELVSLRP